MISTFPNRNRTISTPWLSALLRVHLVPINLIISQVSQTIPHLEAGFPLRCFQRLSIPDIATRQSSGRQSRHTRGQFTPVLSYQEQIFSRINACSRQETNLSHASIFYFSHCRVSITMIEPQLLEGLDYLFLYYYKVGFQSLQGCYSSRY